MRADDLLGELSEEVVRNEDFKTGKTLFQGVLHTVEHKSSLVKLGVDADLAMEVMTADLRVDQKVLDLGTDG